MRVHHISVIYPYSIPLYNAVIRRWRGWLYLALTACYKHYLPFLTGRCMPLRKINVD
nr:MAG TPA: hypothetical protein [Caudoviricetes sp.]